MAASGMGTEVANAQGCQNRISSSGRKKSAEIGFVTAVRMLT
jgi:hypothetical protein